jgi:hypothetical protein
MGSILRRGRSGQSRIPWGMASYRKPTRAQPPAPRIEEYDWTNALWTRSAYSGRSAWGRLGVELDAAPGRRSANGQTGGWCRVDPVRQESPISATEVNLPLMPPNPIGVPMLPVQEPDFPNGYRVGRGPAPILSTVWLPTDLAAGSAGRYPT